MIACRILWVRRRRLTMSRIAVNEAFEGGDRKKLRVIADKLVQ
jgi:hypothetical protein